ncbi:hypothetical protein H9Q69_006371 [Fusarium xylarioides]|nr:hypothetical protein H9Q69_006371 [Fusarium xylarioides]
MSTENTYQDTRALSGKGFIESNDQWWLISANGTKRSQSADWKPDHHLDKGYAHRWTTIPLSSVPVNIFHTIAFGTPSPDAFDAAAAAPARPDAFGGAAAAAPDAFDKGFIPD